MVFRQFEGTRDDVLASRVEAPTVLGFGIEGDRYALLCARIGGVERWRVTTQGTASGSERSSHDGAWTDAARSVFHEDVWWLHETARGAVGSPSRGAPVDHLAPDPNEPPGVVLWMDGALRAVRITRGADGHPALSLCDAVSGERLLGPFSAANTARALLTACATVHGPIAVLSTDREDEVDLCALRPDGAQHRTVSLGAGQRFVAAAGGGSRVAIVSRKGSDARIRTVASDLRSELNPSPLEEDPRAQVGEIRVVHAGAASFAVAHESRGASAEVVLTLFDDGKVRRARARLPALHGIALSGRHLALACLTAGASAAILHVQQFTLTRDEKTGETSPGAARRRAYWLDDATSWDTPRAREAALIDAATVMSLSLAASEPESFALEPGDLTRSRAGFLVKGSDPTRDMAVRIELHAEGSAVVNVRLGPGAANDPRPLGALGRLRSALTGDDDGDPSTGHFEVSSLARELGEIVMAIWALRLTR
jgi:hypothetical protein